VRENNESSEFLEDEFADREFLGLTSDLAAYGRYLDAAPMEIMPVNVWEQIATTLSLESADRIVPDSPAALGSDPAFRELENYRKRRIGGKMGRRPRGSECDPVRGWNRGKCPQFRYN